MSERSSECPGSAGFTYIEVLIAGSLLALSLLGLCSMLVAGYAGVTSAGKTTMGLSAARQLMEDVRDVPFDDLPNLDGFDTDNAVSLPDDGIERQIARRWRYSLAGEGVGWIYTDQERADWRQLTDQGGSLGAVGTISVTSVGADLAEVTVSISVPGRWRPIEMSTRLTRM